MEPLHTSFVTSAGSEKVMTSELMHMESSPHYTHTESHPTKHMALDDPYVQNLAEALASPLKYALFQVLGYECIRAMGPIDYISLCLSGSLRSSACIGALGGGVLAVVFTTLLITNPQGVAGDTSSIRSISSSLCQDLGKEVLYSAFAAVVGVAITGRDSNSLAFLIMAGMIGPIVALSLMLSALGLVIWVVWGSYRLKEWLSSKY